MCIHVLSWKRERGVLWLWLCAHQVFGRLPVCDVPMDHPSISRYHAVLQCRPIDATAADPNLAADNHEEEGNPLSLSSTNEAGFYIYDLNSTHGSFLNKNKLQPRVYYRVRVGQMVRFGGSSRFFVLEVRLLLYTHVHIVYMHDSLLIYYIGMCIHVCCINWNVHHLLLGITGLTVGFLFIYAGHGSL